MLTLSWIKCTDDSWCPLNTVNLDSLTEDNIGVYIIWHGGKDSKVVRVGQGVIKNRLVEHRKDNDIQAYSSLGLNVTWAYLQESQLDGVEAYLADQSPIEVTSPFD